MCVPLSDAAESMPDFNHTLLGLEWFKDMGLHPGKRYGCMGGEYRKRPLFNFGVSCTCHIYETCRFSTLEYSYNNVLYTSFLGECGCCEWSVIGVLALGCAGVIVAIAMVVMLLRPSRAPQLKRKDSKGDIPSDAAKATSLSLRARWFGFGQRSGSPTASQV